MIALDEHEADMVLCALNEWQANHQDLRGNDVWKGMAAVRERVQRFVVNGVAEPIVIPEVYRFRIKYAAEVNEIQMVTNAGADTSTRIRIQIPTYIGAQVIAENLPRQFCDEIIRNALHLQRVLGTYEPEGVEVQESRKREAEFLKQRRAEV